MITVSVREMKIHWSEIENKVRQGMTFTVLNRGKPTAQIIPAEPRKILKWPDHLQTAISCKGKTGAETVKEDREGRW